MARAFTFRFTNTVILALVAILTLTGVYGLVWTLAGWVFDLHRLAGWALLLLIPAKASISLRSLRRGLDWQVNRGLVVAISLLLASGMLILLPLGVLWLWRLGPAQLWLRQTAVSWHWMIALGALVPFGVHVWRRWPRPRLADFTSRRGFLKITGLTAAAVTSWWGSEKIAKLRVDNGSPRRFTGSRGSGLFAGNSFPVTNGPGEGREVIDLSRWRLLIRGGTKRTPAYPYEVLSQLPRQEVVASLDCTLGWFTTQVWGGISLIQILEGVGLPTRVQAVRLRSISGYGHFYTFAEVEKIVLATHVGGEVLSHWHGFPLRAVVPGRRGWFWVKWLSEIEIISLL